MRRSLARDTQRKLLESFKANGKWKNKRLTGEITQVCEFLVDGVFSSIGGIQDARIIFILNPSQVMGSILLLLSLLFN